MVRSTYNMVFAAKELFTADLLTKTAIYLNEPTSSIYKAATAAIPIVFFGLMIKTGTKDGAALINSLSMEQVGGDLDENISALIGEGSSDMLRDTTVILGKVFDKYPGAMISEIAQFADIQKYSASILLSMTTPMVLGMLGRFVIENDIPASGMGMLLNDQRSNIDHATPPEIDMENIFGKQEELPLVKKNERRNIAFAIAVGMFLLMLFLVIYFFRS